MPILNEKFWLLNEVIYLFIIYLFMLYKESVSLSFLLLAACMNDEVPKLSIA